MGGGLGEHKRDILKLREEVNGLTVKSASHEVDIQKNSDAVRKMEKQRNMDEQNWKAQMDAVHDVLDTKVNEKPFEDLKHCVASLTKGTVKFAQVVGVFPGPRFDDAEGWIRARQMLSSLAGRSVLRTCPSGLTKHGGSAARSAS